MKKYIDADKMIKDTELMNRVAEGILIDGIIKYLNDAPAADVTEIVHGKWIDEIGAVDTVGGMRMTIVTGYKCSVCGHSENEKYPFCNCGAKMDKE